ncbi:TetR/AcrR family transcriptional regulator [Amycolatopsis endophytica]|uniref:AcrR family transcriptional regulator n=1 Tax=Amycolatopsis endophytica TaxID=860233 RepID=A0A853BAL1_9PSEU|nr:TetR/AcrR family transcriptional regulator [Amycolatopsis endophytica]NYI91446.1 AcrR family transcriptional regulator [Amycolatopsis endophytica]
MAARRTGGKPTFTEQARRRQLIEATIEVISARGYGGASLAAIAEHAGVSKAAVLYHFGSKDDLAEATLGHVFEAFGAHVLDRMAAAPDTRARLSAYVRGLIDYQGGHRTHVRLITEVLLDDRGGTRFRQPGQHDRNQRWQMLAELLAAGQAEGVFRPFDAKTTALAIGGAIDNVVSQWLADPGLDLTAAADELETFVLRAVEAS